MASDLRNITASIKSDAKGLAAKARAAVAGFSNEVTLANGAIEKFTAYTAEVKAARVEIEGALAEMTNGPPADATTPPAQATSASVDNLHDPDKNGVRVSKTA